MKFNFMENVEGKAFTAKTKHQYHVSKWGEHDCSAQSQKNDNYYKNPSLSHLMNEWL